MTDKPKTLEEMKKDLAEYARDDYHDGCYDTIEKIRAMLMERVKELKKTGTIDITHEKFWDDKAVREELLRITGKEK